MGSSPLAPWCLSSDWNKIENGVRMHLWECDLAAPNAGQQFLLDSAGKIRMAEDPSYCVVIDGDRYQDGAQIQLWKCDESNGHQNWNLHNLPGQISNVFSASHFKSHCLVIDGNKASNGVKIHLWGCAEYGTSAAAAQSWAKRSVP